MQPNLSLLESCFLSSPFQAVILRATPEESPCMLISISVNPDQGPSVLQLSDLLPPLTLPPLSAPAVQPLFSALNSPSSALPQGLCTSLLQENFSLHLFLVVFKSSICCCSVAKLCPGLQHVRFPCPSPSPGVCPSSCPLNR